MNIAHRKSRNLSSRWTPFVRFITPFIGIKKPAICPFVERIIPFVGNRGFTLIELVTTLTIAGILMAIAAPSLFGFLASNRLTSQVNELMADITLSRSEAIKRNTATGICASTTGTGCTSGGNWASGWIVYYVDPTTGANTLVNAHEALGGNNSLSATKTDISTGTTSSADQVAYSKSGILPTNIATYTYTFTLCDSRSHKSRIVTINVTGRPTISESTC